MLRRIGGHSTTTFLGFALALTACKPAPPPASQPPPSPVHAQAADLPAAVTPVNLPAPATVAVARAVLPPVKPLHVSVDIRSGPKMAQELPSVGEPASFRVTLRDAEGQFVSQLDPLLGGKLLLVVARADLGWTVVLRADELSDKNRGTHEFRTVFPLSGIYRMWLTYSYGGQTFTEEVAFSVTGQTSPSHELPESELAWSGERGLAARLKVEPQTPMTCQPFLLATAWTRKEKPLRMTAEPDAPTTWYVAIEGGLGEIATSTAEPQAADPPAGATESMAQKLGGDLGTAATLQVSRPGRYRVLAVATPPGAKAGLKDATVVASFAITVHGELHTGGCSK